MATNNWLNKVVIGKLESGNKDVNGYIGVKFSNDNYAKTYTYKIPDYIYPGDIQKYVVVENALRQTANESPYTIARVVWKDTNGQFDAQYKHATKYIVDTINDLGYAKINNQERVAELKSKIAKYKKCVTMMEDEVNRLSN